MQVLLKTRFAVIYLRLSIPLLIHQLLTAECCVYFPGDPCGIVENKMA